MNSTGNGTGTSYVMHLIAGALIVAIPLLLAGIPESWQSMTVGGLLGAAFKAAQCSNYAGY